MNSKRLGLFALSVFTLAFVMAFASADVLTLTQISVPSSVKDTAGTFTGTYNLTYTGTQPNITVTFTSTSNFGSVTIPDTSINQNESKTITATFTLPSGHAGGTMSGSINATGTGGSTAVSAFSVSVVASSTPTEVQNCISTGNPGDLEVRRIDFTNNGLEDITFGKSSTWFPFENITADIEVKNNGNDRVNNVEVNWGLWDTDTDQWVIEPDNFKEFDLSDGKTRDLSVDFRIDDKMDVDLSDLTDGNHYQLYVYATGEVDNSTAPSTCAYDSKEANIAIESDFVIVNNVQVPDTVQCGQNVEVTANVWNIGDRDQDGVSVRIFGRETALNLSDSILIGSVDAFDKKPLSFSFTVPKNIDEKFYGLDFQVYDDNGDIFQTSNDDNSEFVIPLHVSGGCSASSGQLAVSANIASGGQAGKPLEVRTTITNTGTSTKTYALDATGYSGWASSVSADQTSLTLNPGQSSDVLFTFDTNSNAAGSQTFTIELFSGSDVVRQPVSVTLASAPGFLGITGNAISGNAWIWGIVLLNIILVIVIIIVAVRIARRR